MISTIPSERSNNNNIKRLLPEMEKGKMNPIQGEGEKGRPKMSKETTKTLAQERKGRGRRLIVLDPQPAQVPLPGLPWSYVKFIENYTH